MGTLFPDDDEYPDYRPLPRFTATINGTVVPFAVAATLIGLCPVVLHDREHPPHEEHPVNNPISRLTAVAVSSSSGNSTIALGAGHVSVTGWAPAAVIWTGLRSTHD